MMKTLLALALVTAVASGVVANPYLNTYNGTLALFFDDFTGNTPPPTWDGDTFNTNSDVETANGFAGPFAWAYLVLMDYQHGFFEGLEFGIKTDADWIDGWNDNVTFHTGGGVFDFSAAQPGNYSAIVIWADAGGFPISGATALMRFKVRNWVADEPVNVKLGPMWHLSHTISGRFSVSRGNDKIPLSPAVEWSQVGEDGYATVATFFGDEGDIVATEDHTLSNVKALFR